MDFNTRSHFFDSNEVFTVNSYMEAVIDGFPWHVVTDSTPTRMQHCLDVTLTNDKAAEQTLNWEVLDEAISDHLPSLTSTTLLVRRDKRNWKANPSKTWT